MGSALTACCSNPVADASIKLMSLLSAFALSRENIVVRDDEREV